MTRFFNLILLALVAVLLAPACGSDDNNLGTEPDTQVRVDAGGDVRRTDDAGPGDADVRADGVSDADALDSTDVYVDPFEGLSDDALVAALRQAHTGHRDLGYDTARDILFAHEIEHVGADGEIECVYTGRSAFVEDRDDAQQNANGFNTEHTWPQSRGASGVARSDVHHLFIADGGANSRRSNHFFDNVVDADWQEGGAKLGKNAAGETRFEPRDVHKGNVARALFYFSVVYGYPINADEEAALRAWHVLDPVDEAERARNDAIAISQVTRNFFIDRPELVGSISDF